MTTTALSNLVNVRYYGPNDPYHYSVDNRPLTDLNTNIVLLAEIVDGLSSGNIFYLVDTSTVSDSMEAQAVSLPLVGPYIAGQSIIVKPNNTNTGLVTLKVNNGDPYPVQGMAGTLQGGELVAGYHYLLSWNDTDQTWELVGSGRGSLQIEPASQANQAVSLGQLTDESLEARFNTVFASGVIEAEAGTQGNEVLIYEQVVDGSLSPVFDNIISEGNTSLTNYQRLQASVITPSVSGWTKVINMNEGTIQYVTLQSSGTLSVSGVAPSGYASQITLFLEQGGEGNCLVTWPTTTLWSSGAEPILSTIPGSIDVVTLITFNGGVTWFGFLDGKNMGNVTSPQNTSQCQGTVSDFLASENGYIVSSDGTILQWGTASFGDVGESAVEITFPLAFPNACLGVSCFLSNFSPTDITTYIPQTDSYTTTGATIFMNSEYGAQPSSFSIQFLAVGH